MDLAAYRPHLDRLIRRGRELRDALASDPADRDALPAVRVWQRDCEAIVGQLSGGSKAHWLARAYSEALLLRSPAGRAVEEAAITQLVDRLVDVLARADASLSNIDPASPIPAATAPPVRRFEFVHDTELRPILAHAHADGRRAFEQGRFGEALMIACGVLEAIVTDALEHRARETPAAMAADVAAHRISEWPFETRLAVAEREGLIRGGCARLPAVARKYRDLADANGDLHPDVAISERDARLTAQVLLIVMRDLDPGR